MNCRLFVSAMVFILGVLSTSASAVDPSHIPIIDISSLRNLNINDDAFCAHVETTAKKIYDASVTVGFFYISEHGVSSNLLARLDSMSKVFFALPESEKMIIDMAQGGKAWRGYFAVGAEVTSGIPDQKEGIYFGTELESNEADNRPLHGVNQWPPGEAGLEMKDIVLAYMHEMKLLGQVLMRTISCSLNVTDSSFTAQFQQPTELFRIFNYPPHNDKFGARALGVGEHTDYGYLTLLRQDSNGGLQVKDTHTNTWIDADPVPGTFVVNLGDALEHATRGLFKATPHRVQQRRDTTEHRLSMPYFFDPCFDCEMHHVVNPGDVTSATTSTSAEASDAADHSEIVVDPVAVVDHIATHATEKTDNADAAGGAAAGGGMYTRWDGADPTMFTGTYGKYLLRKVSRAFPALFAQHITQK